MTPAPRHHLGYLRPPADVKRKRITSGNYEIWQGDRLLGVATLVDPADPSGPWQWHLIAHAGMGHPVSGQTPLLLHAVSAIWQHVGEPR